MSTQLDRLEVSAALAGTDLQLKELVHDWVLVTYDLPVNEEGNRARRDFLDTARRIGAIQHTESVYLMPLSPDTDLALLEVTARGRVFIWLSRAKDDAMAREATRQYDAGIDKLFADAEERMERVKEHIATEHYKRAAKMLAKTLEIIDGLERAAVARGSLDLFERARDLRTKYDAARVLVGGLA